VRERDGERDLPEKVRREKESEEFPGDEENSGKVSGAG